jgi:integrase
MTTFKGLIIPHHKKEDGTWNVKIRVTHERKSKYLPTNIFVSKKQLNVKQTKITELALLKKIESQIDEYRRIADDIQNAALMDIDQIITRLNKGMVKKLKVEVDFLAFTKKRITELKKQDKEKTVAGYQTLLNSLQDFFKSEQVLITDINVRSLQQYEEYLKTERIVTRLNQFGKQNTITLKPMGNGITNYMRDLRALFRDAIEEFNDEDNNELVITHYPFRKYKIKRVALVKKRNIKIGLIKLLTDYELKGRADRMELGRDVFLLSFYLVGMNLIDIFEADQFIDGRLIYNRSKTEGRRDDKALISIKVEREAMAIIQKYADPSRQRIFNFYHRYSTINNFTKAVNKGLEQLSKQLELPENITSYVARHSWATIARNNCGVSKDDVSVALNHVDPRHKLTDTYIEKDFRIIDDANWKVLSILRTKTKLEDWEDIGEDFIQSVIDDDDLK